MKFANEHFNEIKSGDILIYIDSDGDFTKGVEYTVLEDADGLFLIDDYEDTQKLIEVLAEYFVIKEPNSGIAKEKAENRKVDKRTEQYYVLRFESGTYYCGSKCASPTLKHAVQYMDEPIAQQVAEQITKQRAPVEIIPIEIREL